MGSGAYSLSDRAVRSSSLGYKTKSAKEIFKQKNINNAMNPHGIKVRESRDSKEHPNSLAIILALDVTGSMGTVPHFLVKEGLPKMMDKIIKAGVPDPQVLFLGIGDHEIDSAPLQVSQFESSDELLDKWLTDIFLEGGGGSNEGESYMLAWYFAANHTSIDCHEKRARKGILFTIGDEPTLRTISNKEVSNIMGTGQRGRMTAKALLEEAQETYDVYHLHISETGAGERRETVDGWKRMLGNKCVEISNHEDVAEIIARIVALRANATNEEEAEEAISNVNLSIIPSI